MTIEKFLMIVKIIMLLNALTALLSLLFYRRRAMQIKLLGLYFLLPVLGYYSVDLYHAKGMEINIPSNILLLVSFLLITCIYYIQFQKRYTRIFLVVVVLFMIFGLFNIFFIQKMYFNSYTASISNFVTIIYCVVYFYRLLIELPEQHLQRVPMFWISTGLLVQSAGAFFLYLFTAYLTKFFFNDVLIYWTFHNLLQILELILIIIGVSVDLKNSITTPRKLHTDVLRKESLFR